MLLSIWGEGGGGLGGWLGILRLHPVAIITTAVETRERAEFRRSLVRMWRCKGKMGDIVGA